MQGESSDWTNTRVTPELTLPPNSFEPGETYELLVTATIKASSGNAAQMITSTSKVNVGYREIIVENRLGGDRIVSPSDNNKLIASRLIQKTHVMSLVFLSVELLLVLH